MANIKSAEKRILQAERDRQRNRAERSRMRSQIKRFRSKVEGGDGEGAQAILGETLSLIDTTARKGVIHRNTAARTKSRLVRALRGIG